MNERNLQYNKGIKLPRPKGYYFANEVVSLVEPQEVLVSVKQAKGKLPVAIVAIGDKVKRGTVVAKSNQTFVFSPISGVVKSIEKRPSIYGEIVDHIRIQNDGKHDTLYMEKLDKSNCSAPAILRRIFQAGIVDGDGYPLFNKFVIDEKDVIDTLVINVCTDEPYLYNNFIILNTEIDKVLKGAEYLGSILKIPNIIFAFSVSLKKQLRPLLNRLTTGKDGMYFSAVFVPERYPAGDTTELVYMLKGLQIKSSQTPKDFGMIIVDMYSLISVTDAVEEGLPNYKKIISIVGADRRKAINAYAYVGDTFENIKNQVKKETDEYVEKVVAGGPMRGVAVSDLSVSVTKTLKGIIFMPREETDLKKEEDCINCGRCNAVCPRGINPRQVEKRVILNDFVDAKKCGAELCTKCGCCDYICPAKRHLMQRISYAKKKIQKGEV